MSRRRRPENIGDPAPTQVSKPVIVAGEEYPSNFRVYPQYNSSSMEDIPDGTVIGETFLEHRFGKSALFLHSVLVWLAGGISQRSTHSRRVEAGNQKERKRKKRSFLKEMDQKKKAYLLRENGVAKVSLRKTEKPKKKNSSPSHADKIRKNESRRGDNRSRGANRSGGRRQRSVRF